MHMKIKLAHSLSASGFIKPVTCLLAVDGVGDTSDSDRAPDADGGGFFLGV